MSSKNKDLETFQQTRLSSMSLSDLAVQINERVLAADQSFKLAMAEYFAAGAMISEARSRMPSDQEFGSWCKKELPSLRQQKINTMKRVYETYRDDPRASSLSLSKLEAMLPLSATARDNLLSRAEDGEPVTRSEIAAAREAMGGAEAPTTGGGGGSPERVAPAGTGGPGVTSSRVTEGPSPEQVAAEKMKERLLRAQEARKNSGGESPLVAEARVRINSPLRWRLENCDNPWEVFGMTDMTEVAPNRDTMTILYSALSEIVGTGTDLHEMLNNAWDEIITQYDE